MRCGRPMIEAIPTPRPPSRSSSAEAAAARWRRRSCDTSRRSCEGRFAPSCASRRLHGRGCGNRHRSGTEDRERSGAGVEPTNRGLPRPAGFEDGGDSALEGRLRMVSDHSSDHDGRLRQHTFGSPRARRTPAQQPTDPMGAGQVIQSTSRSRPVGSPSLASSAIGRPRTQTRSTSIASQPVGKTTARLGQLAGSCASGSRPGRP
jgi:hypothetical protein